MCHIIISIIIKNYMFSAQGSDSMCHAARELHVFTQGNDSMFMIQGSPMCAAQGNDSMYHGARKFHVFSTMKRNIHVYNSEFICENFSQ